MKFNLLDITFYAVALVMLVLLPQGLRAQESDLVPREYAPTASEIDESAYEATAFPASENAKSLRTNTGYVLNDSITSKSSGSSRHAKKSSSENQRATTESQKSVEKNKEEKEKNDSVLSFNFLYYIFQKFKMSDIVDR